MDNIKRGDIVLLTDIISGEDFHIVKITGEKPGLHGSTSCHSLTEHTSLTAINISYYSSRGQLKKLKRDQLGIIKLLYGRNYGEKRT